MEILIYIAVIIVGVYLGLVTGYYLDALRYMRNIRKTGRPIKMIENKWWKCEYTYKSQCGYDSPQSK